MKRLGKDIGRITNGDATSVTIADIVKYLRSSETLAGDVTAKLISSGLLSVKMNSFPPANGSRSENFNGNRYITLHLRNLSGLEEMASVAAHETRHFIQWANRGCEKKGLTYHLGHEFEAFWWETEIVADNRLHEML